MNKFLLFFAFTGASFAFGQTVVFTEDFQFGIPNVWQVRNLDGFTPDTAVAEYTQAYISKLDPSDTLNVNLTASSTSYFSPVGIANRWLISPGIQLGPYGNSVEWKAKSHDPSYPETYLVLVSKTDDLAASFTDTIGYVVQEYADWTTRTVNLSDLGFDNETIFVAFILQTDDGFKFYVDDFSISIEDPVGLEEKQVNQLRLKTLDPSGLYEIASETEIEELKVVDAQGRLIVQKSGKIIDIRSEKSGIYFVQAKVGNDLFYSKLIK